MGYKICLEENYYLGEDLVVIFLEENDLEEDCKYNL